MSPLKCPLESFPLTLAYLIILIDDLAVYFPAVLESSRHFKLDTLLRWSSQDTSNMSKICELHGGNPEKPYHLKIVDYLAYHQEIDRSLRLQWRCPEIRVPPQSYQSSVWISFFLSKPSTWGLGNLHLSRASASATWSPTGSDSAIPRTSRREFCRSEFKMPAFLALSRAYCFM